MIKKIEKLAMQLINKAELQFGSISSEWNYCGIEINDGTPHLKYYPELREVRISLTNKVKEDNNQLLYQLAHEVCHLLYPTMDIDTGTREPTTILNEGISTYFSTCVTCEGYDAEYIQEFIELNQRKSPNYGNAMSAVVHLLNIDKDAIIKLRKIQPKLNKIELFHFEEANILIEEEHRKLLLSEFK